MMSKNEFINKIKDILLIEGEVGTDFYIKIDSLGSMLLIQFYDENFGFKLSSGIINEIKTIGDLVDLVNDKLIE
jgi:acyl carrier protein